MCCDRMRPTVSYDVPAGGGGNGIYRNPSLCENFRNVEGKGKNARPTAKDHRKTKTMEINALFCVS